MDTDKLRKWDELLLDTGKRNNLIHFKESKAGTVEIVYPAAVAVKRFAFPKYVTVDAVKAAHACGNDVFRTCKAILDVEAPLSEEWLLKRIVFMFGREKVTNVVRDEFNLRMKNCGKAGIVLRDGFFYLQGKEIPMLRVPSENAPIVRSVPYIAIDKLASGIEEILQRNVTVEKSGLNKLLVRQLGFTRMGDAILRRLDAALESIKEEIEIEGETLSLR